MNIAAIRPTAPHRAPLMAAGCLVAALLSAAAAQEAPRAPHDDSAPAPAKIERYAEALLRRHDRNGDGVLAPEEWRSMRGNPASIDRDGDHQLAVDELIDHVRRYALQRSLRLLPLAPAAKSPAATPAASAPAQVWRRFFVPRGEGSPEVQAWFDDNDVDGDGQVTMSEFSPTITEVEAARFAEIDADDDGVIVPAEYQRWLPPETTDESSQEPAPQRASP